MMHDEIMQRWSQSVSWVWGRQGQGQGPRQGLDMWLLVEHNRGHHMRMLSCAGPRYWGLMLEGGKHGAGVMPDVSVGMD